MTQTDRPVNRLSFSFPKKLLNSLLSILVWLLALVGVLQILAGFSHTEIVQPFRTLQAFRPDLMQIRYRTLTQNIDDNDSAEQHWQALQHSMSLLQAINPEIANWMERLHAEKRILWKRHATLFNWPVIASFDWRMNDFYFGPDFWQLSEGDKAAAIAHEYFHYKQNKLMMVGDTIVEAFSGKLPEYGSRTEDEAHLYQWFAYRAMDMQPGPIVKGYFNNRNLYQFVLSQTDAKDK